MNGNKEISSKETSGVVNKGISNLSKKIYTNFSAGGPKDSGASRSCKPALTKPKTKSASIFQAFGIKKPARKEKPNKLSDGVWGKQKISIFSWNVNGIRAVQRKGSLKKFLETYDMDILCLNETKIDQEKYRELMLEEWFEPGCKKGEDFTHFWDFCSIKKGYSGTAIITKTKPISARYGLGIEKHDKEGRAVTLEFEKFCLLATYVPNSKAKLLRVDYRTKEWDADVLKYINNLREKTGKMVIWTGDLNVAHNEIDLYDPKRNRKNPGFSDQERESFGRVIQAGWVDTYRKLYPKKVEYSWWSMRSSARSANRGWRIDYFVVDQENFGYVRDSRILTDVYGSDHCPVQLDLDFSEKLVREEEEKEETPKQGAGDQDGQHQSEQEEKEENPKKNGK